MLKENGATLTQRLSIWLGDATDGRVLGLYRILFGLFMTYQCLYYYQAKFIKQGLLAPIMLFKFDGFRWVDLLPEPILQGILFLMMVAAILIAVGVWMKLATIYYGVALSYFMLLEKAYFNNHIYLFILLCLLLAFTNADRFFSVRGNRNFGPVIPRWQVVILQVQIAMVYFYGGLAKLAPDWLLHQEPMRTMVTEYFGYKSEFLVYLLTYSGVLLDLFAPLLLFYKPLRKWVLIPLILFNGINSQMFDDIGVFPFVMLGSLILFFDAHELPWWRESTGQNAVQSGKGPKKRSNTPEGKTTPGLPPVTAGWVKWVLGGYFVFQFLFPFRSFLLPNDSNYTTIGNRFSWRMKIDTREPEETDYFVRRPDTGEEMQIKIENYLNPVQIRLLTTDPRAAVDFAHTLRDKIAIKGSTAAPIIKAKLKLRYNGRPAQYFVDPEIDLSSIQYDAFQKLDWVIPLK